jgi:hypothetical protein
MEQLLMDDKNNDYVFDITEEWVTTDIDTTVTIDTTVNEDLYSMDGITISTVTLGADTITLDDSNHWADNIIWEQTEFVDKMPSLDKINNMCEHYPALEKAFENLKSIYKMVHQDYVGNHEKDDEVPF